MSGKTFEHRLRNYFEDTDAGGIVYHANYLRYFERARGELLRELGYAQNAMLGGELPLIVVSRVEMNFRRPARIDDLLVVKTRIAKLRKASVVFTQTIERESGELLVEASIRCAAVDPKAGVPVLLGETIESALAPLVWREQICA